MKVFYIFDVVFVDQWKYLWLHPFLLVVLSLPHRATYFQRDRQLSTVTDLVQKVIFYGSTQMFASYAELFESHLVRDEFSTLQAFCVVLCKLRLEWLALNSKQYVCTYVCMYVRT